MVRRSREGILIRSALALSVTVCVQSAIAEEKSRSRTHDNCFFHQAADGSVWLGHPLISLGMIGVMDPPRIRLSAELTDRYRPLINTLAEPQKGRYHWWHQLPRRRNPTDPAILLGMRCTMREIAEEEPKSQGFREGRPTTEITASEIFHVEIVPRAWLDGWDELNEELQELVELSRITPGPRKRERIAHMVEKASKAAGRMRGARPSDAELQAVRDTAPQARVVRNVQRQVEREWFGLFRRCLSTLAMKPTTPFPEDASECQHDKQIELLLASDSPTAFIARMKESCSPDALDEILTYSMVRGVVEGRSQSSQPVYTWQIEQWTPTEFAALRTEIKKNREESQRYRQQASGKEIEKPADVLKRKWSVLLRPATSEELADKLLLRAMVVEQVVDGGSPVGLQPGDAIIQYRGSYDLVMEASDAPAQLQALAAKAGRNGEIQVVRGNRIVYIETQKQE